MTGRALPTAPAAAPDLRRRRWRNLLLAIAVPVLLAIAYLAGMSGAEARSNAIPGMIVNNDRMVEQTGVDGTVTPVVAGRLLVSHLTAPATSYGFDWRLADAKTAADALAAGDASVVVTIPEDFSASVVSLGTSAPTQAQLLVTTDQAHDYLSGQAARALADAVVAEFGTDVTQMVAIGLVQGMDATGAALQQAADGAGQLANGADLLVSGFDTYTIGQQQITDGLAQSADGAVQLSSGVSQYVDGVGQFTSGVDQYSSGVDQYVSGVNQFAGGVTQYTAGVDQLAGGLAQLDQGSSQLSGAADQIDQATAGLSSVAGDLENAQAIYEQQVKPQLDELSASADTLTAMCDELADPARQAECRAAAGNVSGATSTATGFVDGLLSDTSGIGQVTTGIDQLGQLSSGLRQLAGGISQASSGAAQLSAASGDLNSGAAQLTGAGGEITSGGAQLRSGGADLRAGGGQLASGTNELASGLGQLAAGQAQLAAGNAPIRDGMTGLGSGATQLQSGLQQGADRATGALGDPGTYADVLSHPVVANVDAQGDPGWGGLLASLAVPIAAWVAAAIAALARRLVTAEGLASTATTGRLVWRATTRLAVPTLLATLVVALACHLAGAPWVGLVGTLALGLMAAIVAIALHLLFVAVWGRRGGAIASIAALALQLVAVGGVLPMALRAGWVDALASVSPLSHAAAGLQLVYAGGSAAGIAMAFVSLALIALLAFAAAWLVVARRRRTDLGHVINLRELGLPLRAPDPA